MFGIRNRIVAILMSLYVFLAGIPYGNDPVMVDFTAKATVVRDGECRIYAEVTNIGRPYKGSTDDSVFAVFYRIYRGEKQLVDTDGICSPEEPRNVLVKHGDVRKFVNSYSFLPGYEPGEYIVEIRVNHSDKVYTETITLT